MISLYCHVTLHRWFPVAWRQHCRTYLDIHCRKRWFTAEGNAAFSSSNFELAVQHYSEALKVLKSVGAPNDSVIILNRSAAYIGLKRFVSVVDFFWEQAAVSYMQQSYRAIPSSRASKLTVLKSCKLSNSLLTLRWYLKFKLYTMQICSCLKRCKSSRRNRSH